MVSLRSLTGAIGISEWNLRSIVGREDELFDILTIRRAGNERRVLRPLGELETLLQLVRGYLEKQIPYVPSEHVHGFVKGRSAKSAASTHLGQREVARVDIRHFFESISASKVQLELSRAGFDEDSSAVLTQLLTPEGHLATGFCTSPFLSQLAMADTDKSLSNFGVLEGLLISRYVDDICISGERASRQVGRLKDLVESLGWEVNEGKTRVMRRGGPQFVNGLYVGLEDRPRLPRNYKRHLRWVAHIISQVGYEQYMLRFGGIDEGLHPAVLAGHLRHTSGIEPKVAAKLEEKLDSHWPDWNWYDVEEEDSPDDGLSGTFEYLRSRPHFPTSGFSI